MEWLKKELDVAQERVEGAEIREAYAKFKTKEARSVLEGDQENKDKDSFVDYLLRKAQGSYNDGYRKGFNQREMDYIKIFQEIRAPNCKVL